MPVCITKLKFNKTAGAAAFLESFIRKGNSTDYTRSRGVRSKVVTIDFQASGPKQYATNKVINFDYDQELSDSRIMAIELLGTPQMLFTPTQPAKDMPQSDLPDGFFIVKDNCNNIVMKTPLANLCKALNGNKSTPVDFKNIDWGSCGIVFNTAATISSANAIPFRIHFQ